jgi:peptidoglycan/xylan/chitin deacetylase (PgdA/CDA1 family)
MRFDGLSLKAEFAWRSGLTAKRLKTLGDGLYVFNFHRIGDRNATTFDPNIYSCTPDALRQHIVTLKRHFDLIDPGDLENCLREGSRGRYALLTFDDGYLDNYTVALPILRELEVSAIFFICTGFIDSNEPPWWDRAAFMVRHRTVNAITLNGKPIDFRGKPADTAIRDVLREFKLIEAKAEEKLSELEDQLRPARSPSTETLFMSWDNIADACAQGIAIGSHSVSHDKLSHLSLSDQTFELSESKRILEKKLSKPVSHLAYPVGGLDSFTSDSTRLASELGYEFAFTTEQHVNEQRHGHEMALGRFSVSLESPRMVQYMMLQHIAQTKR